MWTPQCLTKSGDGNSILGHDTDIDVDDVDIGDDDGDDDDDDDDSGDGSAFVQSMFSPFRSPARPLWPQHRGLQAT